MMQMAFIDALLPFQRLQNLVLVMLTFSNRASSIVSNWYISSRDPKFHTHALTIAPPPPFLTVWWHIPAMMWGKAPLPPPPTVLE